MGRRNTVMKWFGGKFYLLDDLFPFPFHNTFVDVFGGSGVVILNKVPAIRDIYNDINKNLFGLFTTLKDKFEKFIFASQVIGAFDSRDIWEWAKSELEKDNVSDLENIDITLKRAVLFYYVQCLSFSGMGKDFHGLDGKESTGAHLVLQHKINETLKEIYPRLKRITFENKDFRVVLKRQMYLEEDCLLYLDPPYLKGGEQYQKMIGGNEWKTEYLYEMAELVKDVNAYVCISIDCPHEMLGLSGSKWNSQKIARYQRSNQSRNERNVEYEYVIRNYDQKTVPKLTAEHSLKDFLSLKGDE